MRIIHTILILAFSCMSNAEESLRAGLTCEIKKQGVADMVKGEAKSYSGIKDGLDDGWMQTDKFVAKAAAVLGVDLSKKD